MYNISIDNHFLIVYNKRDMSDAVEQTGNAPHMQL